MGIFYLASWDISKKRDGWITRKHMIFTAPAEVRFNTSKWIMEGTKARRPRSGGQSFNGKAYNVGLRRRAKLVYKP
jgi:hypothetical protein